MCRIPIFSALIVFAGLLSFTDAQPQERQTSEAGSPKPPLPGDALLDQAIRNLRNLTWIDTVIWQQMNSQGVKLETTGRYVAAPKEGKVYYQLDVRIGGATGQSKLVSDGKTAWQLEQVGNKKTVHTYKASYLKAVLQDTGEDDVGRQVREELSAQYGLAGVRPILQDLRKNMTFPRVQSTALTRPGKVPVPVYLLEGEWNQQTRELISPRAAVDSKAAGKDKAELWDPFVPRKCRCYLAQDWWWPWASSLWPYRIEWHGPTKPQGPDELLLTLEFRDPVIQPPEAQAERDRIFAAGLSDEEKALAKDLNLDEVVKKRREFLKGQKETGRSP